MTYQMLSSERFRACPLRAVEARACVVIYLNEEDLIIANVPPIPAKIARSLEMLVELPHDLTVLQLPGGSVVTDQLNISRQSKEKTQAGAQRY